MKVYEPQIAAAVIAVGTFELWKVWNDCAPSISEVRNADKNDPAIRTQLFDADVTVGTLAVVIGAAFALISRDATALVLILVMFGVISFLHHYLLNQ